MCNNKITLQITGLSFIPEAGDLYLLLIKQALYLLVSLTLISCVSENKETKVATSKMDLDNNKSNSLVSQNNRPDDYGKGDRNRRKLFYLFLKKFKKVALPYTYRLTSKTSIDLTKMPKLDKSTTDTLFAKTDYIEETYCYGMLADTTKFYSLIFFFPADDFYPVLTTYTKSGAVINQKPLTVNGCGSDCGLTYCSQTVEISKNLLISSADSIKYDYQCDEEGNLQPNSSVLIIEAQKGKIRESGKIEIINTVRLENKIPATTP